MPAPAKPKKSVRNRPDVFDEMITVTLPASPVMRKNTAQGTLAPAGGNSRLAKRALIIIWLAAVIAAGIGVGRLISANLHPATTEAGLPVATATVAITAVSTSDIVRPQASHPVDLTVKSSSQMAQAQAGSTFETVSTAAIQGTGNYTFLQPGFSHAGHIQGTIGTSAVR